MIATARFCLFLLMVSSPCVPAFADDTPVRYGQDVVPFLDEYCIACHDDGFETSDLSVHSIEAMLKGGRRGAAIVPGKASESLLIQFLKGEKQPQMPPKTSIPLDQIARLEAWINQGAKADEADLAAVASRREEARKAAENEAAAFASDAPPPVTSMAFSPDGKSLAVASYKEVVLVDPSSGTTLRHLTGFPDQVTAVAFSPDGTRLAGAGGSPGRQGEVRLWETRQWREVGVLRGHDDTVLALAWRPGSDQLATASLDKRILVWNGPTGQVVREIKSHADIVNALAYSPDGTRLASGSADKTAKLFDADTGLQTAGLSTHNDAVLQVVFSPDGQFLATASADRSIALWKLDSLNNPQRRFGHNGPVYALTWQPDSTSVWAGAGGKPSVLSYLRDNGNRAVSIDEKTMPQDWVYAVAVAPDNQTVAAGGWDGTITLWNLKAGQWLRTITPAQDPEGP